MFRVPRVTTCFHGEAALAHAGRLAVGRGGQPLRNTGTHLMNAVSYSVEGNSVSVGVPPAWASVLQFGGTISAKNSPFMKFKIGNQWVQKKSVKIPARPFLGGSTSDQEDIVQILR